MQPKVAQRLLIKIPPLCDNLPRILLEPNFVAKLLWQCGMERRKYAICIEFSDLESKTQMDTRNTASWLI